MTKEFEFDIRYSEMEDIAQLRNWITDPEDMRWFPVSAEKETEDYIRNWIGFSRYRASLTATHNDEPCAIGTLFLMPYKKVAHECMLYMIVDPKHRKKGVGTSLLKNLLNLADKHFSIEGINIEIYEGCLLLPLLKKQGFKMYAKQENFVKEENGYLARILMDYFFKDK